MKTMVLRVYDPTLSRYWTHEISSFVDHNNWIMNRNTGARWPAGAKWPEPGARWPEAWCETTRTKRPGKTGVTGTGATWPVTINNYSTFIFRFLILISDTTYQLLTIYWLVPSSFAHTGQPKNESRFSIIRIAGRKYFHWISLLQQPCTYGMTLTSQYLLKVFT